MWSYTIVDTRTGVRQLQVFPSSGRWSRGMGANVGSGAHTFQLADEQFGAVMRDKSLTAPWSRTLVVSWDGVVEYAGLITARPYDRDSQTLTVRHSEVREIFTRRYPFGTSSYWVTEGVLPGKLVCSNLSLRAIAATAVLRGLEGPFPIYSLPIILPNGAESGTHSRTYQNYTFTNVDDILREMEDMEGGPEIDFEPRWSASNTLEWVMRAGSAAAPRLTGPLFEFNMTAPEPRLTGVTVVEDATKQMSGVFSVGNGSEVDMVVAGQGLQSAAPFPALDAVHSHKSEKNVLALAAFSRAALAQLQYSTVEWSASVMAGDVVGLQIGSTIRQFYKDDPWIADGITDLRVIGFAGDMSDTVTPILQGF